MIALNTEDTICAIATPQGKGALAIVRMSGKKSFDIIRKVFETKKDFSDYDSHTAIFGNIKDKNKIVDEVICIKYISPNSFTGEDLVEINCHGGYYIANRILEIVLEKGARVANPGEFSKRAFLNSRIDLSQAEAIQELISSESKMANELAIKNLKGELSTEINNIREKLIELTANIDVLIDYPEYDYEELKYDNILSTINTSIKQISNLLSTYERGKMVKEGIRIVIAGRPNVGKSTFLNKFIGKNRAIVTDIPGTTRDTIEEKIEIKGFPVVLIDTAGIRETTDEIEKIGVDKTKNAISEASIILLVIDAKTGVTEDVLKMLKEQKHKDVLLIVNKIDKVDKNYLDNLINNIDHSHIASSSFINNEGMDKIEDKILELLNLKEIDDSSVVLTNMRHKNLLSDTNKSLNLAKKAVENNMPLDLIEIDIKQALYNLGEITGDNTDEDIVNTIFSQFCLGK